VSGVSIVGSSCTFPTGVPARPRVSSCFKCQRTVTLSLPTSVTTPCSDGGFSRRVTVEPTAGFILSMPHLLLIEIHLSFWRIFPEHPECSHGSLRRTPNFFARLLPLHPSCYFRQKDPTRCPLDVRLRFSKSIRFDSVLPSPVENDRSEFLRDRRGVIPTATSNRRSLMVMA